MAKYCLAFGMLVLGLFAARPAVAQEPATLVLRSGDRISGDLVDLGGVGFTIRVNGQDRQVNTSQVAVVEFTGGSPSDDVRARLSAGRSVVVLRNGQMIEGSLFDLGGTRPLRVTLDTPNGQREYTSNDVAQIYYALPGGSSSAAAQEPEMPATAMRINGNQTWVNTGITVRRGEMVTFRATGNIMAAEGASAGVAGSPILDPNRMPLRGAPGGALIGRVGNGAPFLIGANPNPIQMPAAGRLQIGINDDNVNDNTGYFTVDISRQAGVVRRR
jgi:hypothetical protein